MKPKIADRPVVFPSREQAELYTAEYIEPIPAAKKSFLDFISLKKVFDFGMCENPVQKTEPDTLTKRIKKLEETASVLSAKERTTSAGLKLLSEEREAHHKRLNYLSRAMADWYKTAQSMQLWAIGAILLSCFNTLAATFLFFKIYS